MRFLSQLLIFVLCLGMVFPAWAEESGEKRLEPDEPVPEYVAWLLETAENELGYTEEAGGVTKYGTWAGYPTAEWCAEFLCWCVHRVDQQHGTKLLNQLYPNYSGTNVGRNWFLSQGRYIARSGFVPDWGSQWWKGTDQMIEKNSYVPQPGDWMFLSDNSQGDTSHVAMVEYCTQDENGKIFVHVIEGNNVTKPAPQSVERNVYALDYWKILGYGTVRDLADITLRFGSSGPKVVELQNELIAAGLMAAQYNTGRFGAITQDAVKQVQRKFGILETGIANLETRLAIRELAERVKAESGL